MDAWAFARAAASSLMLSDLFMAYPFGLMIWSAAIATIARMMTKIAQAIMVSSSF
jgi:hypothetical protein